MGDAAAPELDRLNAVVFGAHTALVMEPVTWLRRLVPAARVRVFMRDCPRGHPVHGHHCMLQCELLGDCDDGVDDPALQALSARSDTPNQ